jgi:hypothetical protein
METQFVYSNMEDVKRANRQIGNHWFDPETVRFFRTRICSELIAGAYFITSEQYSAGALRLYSIRRAQPDGTIETIGDFQQYRSKAEARAAIRRLLIESN